MIPYGRQDVTPDDIRAVVDVLQSNWLTTGPAVDAFEYDLAKWTNGVPVVAVSSGTAALHAAYKSAGLGPGDEVITPPITFIATQAMAIAVGATIVFADVLPDTATIDPQAVDAAITKRTRAIVAVDYAGHPAEMGELRAIADKHGLLLIQDSAHSLGSLYRGEVVGSLADITAFSFFPTKNITTGEGGALAIRDADILQTAREFSRQGLVRDRARHQIRGEGPWHQEVHDFGVNYRLPDVLATLGSQQLLRLTKFKDRRSEIKARYDQALGDADAVEVPTQRPYADPVWHLYPLRVSSHLRQELFEFLTAQGVGVQVNYMPAYWHPAMADLGYKRGLCPVAEDFYSKEISLPIFYSLSDSQVDFVSDCILKFL